MPNISTIILALAVSLIATLWTLDAKCTRDFEVNRCHFGEPVHDGMKK